MVKTMLRVAAAAAALAVFASAAEAQVIWRGRSGGFDVTWTASDISARRASDGALVFSARRMADHEWAEMSTDADPPITAYQQTLRLLSVVGSVISVEEATYCECGGAHPMLGTRFVAYDLARSTVARPHAVSATDLVPEAELVRALTADRLVRMAMDSAHVRGFTSLRALVAGLKWKEIWPDGPEECTYAIGEEMPTEFAVHHVEGNRVALRFSLTHSVEICRGRYVQVGVLVAPNARFAPDVAAASARRAGYLMKDERAIAGDRTTTLSYEPKPPRSR